MNESDAYKRLASRTGIDPAMLVYLPEVTLDLTVLNPIVEESLKRLGPLLDLRPGMRVLDLACGKAGLTLPLVRTYKVRLLGLDLMPDFIRECWARAEYTGLYENCDFREEDAAEFAARTKSQWDAVFCVGALTYVWDGLEAGLAALKPLVKPQGWLVVGLPYRLPGGEDDPR